MATIMNKQNEPITVKRFVEEIAPHPIHSQHIKWLGNLCLIEIFREAKSTEGGRLIRGRLWKTTNQQWWVNYDQHPLCQTLKSLDQIRGIPIEE